MGYRADGKVEITLQSEDQVAFVLAIEEYLKDSHDPVNGMSVPLYGSLKSHSVFDIIEAIFDRWGFVEHRLLHSENEKITYIAQAGHKWLAGAEAYGFLKFLASLGAEVYGYFRGEDGDAWEYVRDEESPDAELSYVEYTLIPTRRLRELEAAQQSLSVAQSIVNKCESDVAPIPVALEFLRPKSSSVDAKVNIAQGGYFYQLLRNAWASEHYVEESLGFYSFRKDAEEQCLNYIIRESEPFRVDTPWGSFPEGASSPSADDRGKAMAEWFTSHSFAEITEWYRAYIKAHPQNNTQDFEIIERQISHSQIPLRMRLINHNAEKINI